MSNIKDNYEGLSKTIGQFLVNILDTVKKFLAFFDTYFKKDEE